MYLEEPEIVEYVYQRVNVHYDVRGMSEKLHSLKFTYRKPVRVPGNANCEEAEALSDCFGN
jgi:transposase